MKKLLLILGFFILSGCASKVIVKKDNSIYQQKQDAKRAWRELDKD